MNQFIRSRKGISGIVTTLMIVLLAIVAAAILFVVIRGLVERGASDIEIGTKCLETSIKITKADCTGTLCSITLTRQTGDDEIGGVDIVFENREGTESSEPIELKENIEKLQLKTIEGHETGLQDPGKVKAQVFYIDASGAKESCIGVVEFQIN